MVVNQLNNFVVLEVAVAGSILPQIPAILSNPKPFIILSHLQIIFIPKPSGNYNLKPKQIEQEAYAEKPTLTNVNWDIPVGSLVATVGSTSEGKTSLISAMLGELPSVSDASVVMRRMVAYVPQVSWIFNATGQKNETPDAISRIDVWIYGYEKRNKNEDDEVEDLDFVDLWKHHK